MTNQPREFTGFYSNIENYSVRFDNGLEYVTKHFHEAESIARTFAALRPQIISTFDGWNVTPDLTKGN